MIELLAWLSKMEAALARALSRAGVDGRRARDPGLDKVAAGKRKLARQMLSAASAVRSHPSRTPVISGTGHLRDDIESSLSLLSEAISSGMDGAELAEALAVHEYLKWNGLVVAIANAARDIPQAVPVLARAQRHKKAVEAFLAAQGSAGGLFRLRASDPVWKERFLVIGRLEPSVEEGLRKEGVVESARRGSEAIERLRERYYGALISEEALPDLAGMELCREAARIFPGIEERFLFLYSAPRGKRAGKGRGGPRRLDKSAGREKILEEVGLILDR